LNRYKPGLVLACFGLAAGLAPAVRAQSLQQQVRTCSAETDDARRLSCYDRAAATLDKSAAPASRAAASTSNSTANSGKAASAPTPAPTAASSDADFGVSEGPLAAKKQATGLKEITAVVTSVSVRPRGELLMTLDNGQVWQQNQAVEYFPLNVGDTVKIRSAALGSYLLLTPAKRTAKVTRVR
jgi:hypothetical protein